MKATINRKSLAAILAAGGIALAAPGAQAQDGSGAESAEQVEGPERH